MPSAVGPMKRKTSRTVLLISAWKKFRSKRVKICDVVLKPTQCMSLKRMPFQSVNESKIEAIVGIQTRPTCRIVGIPTIASATQRSRPSNCRSRRVFGAATECGRVLDLGCRCHCCPRCAARVKSARRLLAAGAIGVTPRR